MIEWPSGRLEQKLWLGREFMPVEEQIARLANTIANGGTWYVKKGWGR